MGVVTPFRADQESAFPARECPARLGNGGASQSRSGDRRSRPAITHASMGHGGAGDYFRSSTTTLNPIVSLRVASLEANRTAERHSAAPLRHDPPR